MNPSASTVPNSRSCIRSRVFVQTVIVALAALPYAHASVEAVTTRPSVELLGTETVEVVLANAASSPTTDGATDFGGAVFSPFAVAPAKAAPSQGQESRHLDVDGADPTFAAITGLLGFGAIAYVLHRTRNLI